MPAKGCIYSYHPDTDVTVILGETIQCKMEYYNCGASVDIYLAIISVDGIQIGSKRADDLPPGVENRRELVSRTFTPLLEHKKISYEALHYEAGEWVWDDVRTVALTVVPPATPTPTPVPATPTPTPAPVNITIDSIPTGADIVLDGTELLRKTPETFSLSPKVYSIELSMPGYEPYRTTFVVVAGTPATHSYTLTPITTPTPAPPPEIIVRPPLLAGSVNILRSRFPTTIIMDVLETFRMHLDNTGDITARYMVTLQFINATDPTEVYPSTSAWTDPIENGRYKSAYVYVVIPRTATEGVYNLFSVLEAEEVV